MDSITTPDGRHFRAVVRKLTPEELAKEMNKVLNAEITEWVECDPMDSTGVENPDYKDATHEVIVWTWSPPSSPPCSP